MPYQGKFNFYHGLAISLLLHLCLTLPLFLPALHLAHHRSERLNVEVFGMISNRDVAEQHAGSETPQQTRRAVQAANNPVSRSAADKFQAESPVKVEKADDRPSQPVSQPAAGVSAPAAAGGEGEQVQSHKDQVNPSANEMSSYMARVSRRIQANQVYPKEFKGNGIQAVTTIAFTITSSGNIREGSLRVINGSGYQILDASALRTARDCVPFEVPPTEEVDIVVNLSFDYNL